MSLFTTSKTKWICTGTAHSGDARPNGDLVTSCSWTIPHGFTRFDEIPSYKHGVPVPYFCIQQRPKEQPRHRLGTFMLWTVSTYACRTLRDLISQIFSITKLAKFMITSCGNGMNHVVEVEEQGNIRMVHFHGYVMVG